MPEISDAELRLFARYQNIGTPEEITKKFRDLETDNKNQRDEIRDLKEKMPGEDQVIVSKKDADLLPKYTALGEPKDLKAKLEAGEEAEKNFAIRARRDAALDYVRAAGLAEETVDTLISLPDLADVAFEVKTGKVKDAKGQEVDGKLPYLVITDDKGAKENIDFGKAQERFPALKGLKTAEPVKGSQQRPTPNFVQQSPGDKGGASETLYDRIRRERKEHQEKEAARLKDAKSVDERLGRVRAQ